MADTKDVANSDSIGLVEVIQQLSKFKNVDPKVIQMYVDDATAVVKSYGVPDVEVDRATRLYACHLLLVQAQVDNGNISESIGSLSHTRADWSKLNDPYWNDFQSLLNRYGLSRDRGRVWTVD